MLNHSKWSCHCSPGKLVTTDFVHFPLLKEANISGELAAKYKVQLDSLAVKFDRRIQDLRTWNSNLISSALQSLQKLIQLLRIYSWNCWTCMQIMIWKGSSSQIHCLASTSLCMTICFQTWKTAKNRSLLTDTSLHENCSQFQEDCEKLWTVTQVSLTFVTGIFFMFYCCCRILWNIYYFHKP